MQVKERLGTSPSYVDRSYAHPKHFLEDMRLIWANCRRYNREMTDVRKWGEALSDMFEKRWHASGIEAKWAEEEQRQLIEQVVSGAVVFYALHAYEAVGSAKLPGCLQCFCVVWHAQRCMLKQTWQLMLPGCRVPTHSQICVIAAFTLRRHL